MGQAVEEEQAGKETQANHPGEGGARASGVQVGPDGAETIGTSGSQGLQLLPGAIFEDEAINACRHDGRMMREVGTSMTMEPVTKARLLEETGLDVVQVRQMVAMMAHLRPEQSSRRT